MQVGDSRLALVGRWLNEYPGWVISSSGEGEVLAALVPPQDATVPVLPGEVERPVSGLEQSAPAMSVVPRAECIDLHDVCNLSPPCGQ